MSMLSEIILLFQPKVVFFLYDNQIDKILLRLKRYTVYSCTFLYVSFYNYENKEITWPEKVMVQCFKTFKLCGSRSDIENVKVWPLGS